MVKLKRKLCAWCDGMWEQQNMEERRWHEFLRIYVSGWYRVRVDCEHIVMVVCGRKWGHVYIIACSGGVTARICMCVTHSISSGQAAALEIGSTHPCWTDGGQLDAPMQSQPNLEHWHWVQVTFPIYPWFPLPSGRNMPAITSSLLLPSNLLCSRLPTTPLSYQSEREMKWGREHWVCERDNNKKKRDKREISIMRIYRENEKRKARWKDDVVEMGEGRLRLRIDREKRLNQGDVF